MLADRLIQDQVRCAQQEEQICILRQKVASSSKQSSSDSSPQVPYSVTVTVTKVFILRFLLKDRKRITESFAYIQQSPG